jgi:membrane-associated protease RseP (regulator of RpoE activity)
MNEIYHYPFLCVGWFGMFVTSLNMLPMGQLDGGHITFAMFGSKQSIIARISWWIIFSLGIGSFLGWFYEQIVVESPGEFYTTIQSILLPTFLWIKLHAPWIYNGWNGWLFWALITRFFIKLDHPPVSGDSIGPIRMILGWLSLCIFVVTFAYNGIYEIPKQEDIIHRNIDRNTSKEKKIIELLPQMDIYHDIKTTYGYSLNPCLLTSDIF